MSDGTPGRAERIEAAARAACGDCQLCAQGPLGVALSEALDKPAAEPTKLFNCDDPDLPNPVTGYDSWLDVQMRDPEFRAHFAVAMAEYRAENPETPTERRSVEEIAQELCSDIFILSVGSCPTLRDAGRDDVANALGSCVAGLPKLIADALRAERGEE